MGGALDKAVAGVEKLVGLPFQADAAMRAAIEVDVDLAAATHGKEFAAFDLEAAAAVIGQFGACAKNFMAILECRNL